MQARASALILLAAVIATAAASLFLPGVLNGPDTFWHIAAGGWMLDHHQVVRTDVFSFSKAGAPWSAHEWLSEVLMALSYRLAGWSGVVILTGLAAAGAIAVMGRQAATRIGGISLVVLLALSIACLAPSLLARPHILVLPLLAGWMAVLMDARERSVAPSPVWALLLVLWANMHGSYVIAFLIAGAFGLEALIAAPRQDWLKVIRGWGLFALASLVAIFITPHGLSGVIHPLQLMTMTTLPDINEWRPADFSHFSAFEGAILLVLFVGFYRGVWVGPVRLILLLFLTHMALQHTRHVLVLAVVAPMILAGPFARALKQDKPRAFPDRGFWVLAAVAFVILAGVRLALPVQRVDGPVSPIAAVATVPADLASKPVLNDYDFGGFLIFKGIRPYIDGRADMYGDAFVDDYMTMARGDETRLDRILAEQAIAWTIFPPNSPVAEAMKDRPGWKRLYAGSYAVVDIRAAP